MFRLSEHFLSSEFACKHCHQLVINPALIKLMEAIRAKVGLPVIVNCGYRCEVHNRQVGGVVSSQHLLGNAADIRVTGLTVAALYALVRGIPGLGGVGVDEHKGYVHVDVRPIATKGHIAKWCYDIHGGVSPWDSALDFQDGKGV